MLVKYINQAFFISFIIFGFLLLNKCATPVGANSIDDGINYSQQQNIIAEFPSEELNQGEIDGLIYMREEEKLARDVYISLYNYWGKRVFNNISVSENRHMESIKILLNKYNIEDPVNIDSIGLFKNETLHVLYDSLIQKGYSSMIEALKVGALIEEIDIIDIQRELENNVDNQDIKFVYNNLFKGSENHLRAFVRNLSRQAINYSPQVMVLSEYQLIINDVQTRGGKKSNRRR
jgi:hypothetical protein